jgi:flagellar hook-associated protein 2
MSTSAIFSGNSRFANDLQQVIDRTVAIASLPLRQLQQQRATTASQQTAITSLSSKFSALRNSILAVDSGMRAAPIVTLDVPQVARVTASDGVLATEISLEVLYRGTSSTAISADNLTKVTNPSTESITSDTTVTLMVNGVPLTISPPVGSLNALAQAINDANGGVRASVVNIGPPESPDYRLTLRSDTLGDVSIGLSGGSGSLSTQLAHGTLAQYRVDGFPSSPIASSSRNVTLAPGLSAELQAAGTTTITLAPDISGMAESISTLVAAFNAAVDEIDTHRGTGTGALQGNSLPSDLATVVKQLTQYQSGGTSIGNLADVGLEVDKTGHLQFNTATFTTAMEQHGDEVRAFLGSSFDGGFLKAASDTLGRVDSLSGGILTDASSNIARALSVEDSHIADQQERIALMEENLRKRMAAADALIALLEQRSTMVTGLFKAAQSNDNN